MKLAIVSGLSGAGKSVALKLYEDFGYFCIDNLPLALLGPLSLKSKRYERLAVGIDARASGREIARFQAVLKRHRDRGIDVQVLFLTASDEVILRRYAETRRKHPLTGEKLSLAEAVQRERKLLEPVVNAADTILDTSHMSQQALREELRARVIERPTQLSLVLTSFGFKNGTPDNADYVFDVRGLPNPYWVPELAPLDGRDPAIAKFLEREPLARAVTQDILGLLERWLPHLQDRAYVTVAVGCTGGRHRSVYVVERLAEALRKRPGGVVVKHSELDRKK